MTRHEIRIAIADRIANLLCGGTQLPIELYPFQRETLAATETWLRDEHGTPRGHVVYATGLGKTVVFAALIAACAGIRTLVVVPTKTLLEQTARTIVRFAGGIVGHISSMPVVLDEQGNVIAVRTWRECDIVVTTDESLALRAQQIARDLGPQLVIYDECHWAYSHPARFAIGCFPDAVVIGFTATPDYLTTVAKRDYVPVTLENGTVLYGPLSRFARSHFGTKLDDRSVLWGIEEGYLSPLAWGRVDLDISLDQVPLVEGAAGLDYSEAALKETLRQRWSETCQAMITLYRSGEYELRERQTFTICSSVDEAEELARAIASIDVPSACVTGKTRDSDRRRILTDFRANKIKFITSVMVLREGWDSPNAEVCVMLRPTKSRVLYVQSIGRVLRTIPGDDYKIALVIDAHYQGTEFAPLSAPVVFGEPGQRVRVGGVLLGDARTALSTHDPGTVLVEPPRQQIELTVDHDGVLRHEGEEWWSAEKFAAFIHLSPITVLLSAKEHRARAVLARTVNGRQKTFFALADLRKRFANHVSDLPTGDRRGILMKDGKEWWSIVSFAMVYQIVDSLVRQYAYRDRVPHIDGLNWCKRRCAFYELEALKRTCASLMANKSPLPLDAYRRV